MLTLAVWAYASLTLAVWAYTKCGVPVPLGMVLVRESTLFVVGNNAGCVCYVNRDTEFSASWK